MIPSVRNHYNNTFTEEKYLAYLREMDSHFPGARDFRPAETPVFVPKDFRDTMIATCESIVDLILDPDFKKHTDRAIPEHLRVHHENGFPHFIAFDFGICRNADNGSLEPQLIEMQGFATLFGFQVLMADSMEKHFDIPGNFSPYLGCNREQYLQELKSIVLGKHDPGQVILLEIFPHQQKTRIDFYYTEKLTGIKAVCLTELVKEGRKLYYMNGATKTEIRRIYNRLIFDELLQQPAGVQEKGKILFEDLEVEWVAHPAWFYRISKFTLPFIHHPHVPVTYFLNEIKQLPADLENYVLKPLFSFAGQGVLVDVTTEDIEKIENPENWILQRKVTYADIIETPDDPAKAELRIFYFWKDGDARPKPVNNLARLSKGKMIGVSFNKDKTWVGGSLCYFEQ